MATGLTAALTKTPMDDSTDSLSGSEVMARNKSRCNWHSSIGTSATVGLSPPVSGDAGSVVLLIVIDGIATRSVERDDVDGALVADPERRVYGSGISGTWNSNDRETHRAFRGHDSSVITTSQVGNYLADWSKSGNSSTHRTPL